MCKVINVTKDGFEFEDIPFIRYPMHIKSKRGDKYFNLKATLTRKECHSRTYQLSHRSTQAYLFDKLIEVDYFKLRGINYDILKEVPIINTDLDNDPDRSYYLLDYFIPDLSLCIELDSDYHDPIKDKMKDDFLNSIGIKVYRIYDFQVNTKEKLEMAVKIISDCRINEFQIDYNCEKLCESYRLGYDKYSFRKYVEEKVKSLYFMSDNDKESFMYDALTLVGVTPDRSKRILKLCIYDINILYSFIDKSQYSFDMNLDDLYEIIPMSRKEKDKYTKLRKFMESYGIHMNIISRYRKRQNIITTKR